MTDEEVICTFMEPARKVPSSQLADVECSDHGWWEYDHDVSAWYPSALTLNELHLVEERLTEEQWHGYKWELCGITAPLTHVASIRDLIHATAEQKIEVLAQVLRPIVETNEVTDAIHQA